MSNNPIFDQLQAEFTERSKYCRLLIGPPAGPEFVVVNGVKAGFEIVDRVTQLWEYGPVAGEDFEVVDGVTKLIGFEEAPKPKLYIIEGAPELVRLDEPMEMIEETDVEKTILIPVFKSDTPAPPSITLDESLKPPLMVMLEDTQAIPVISAINDESKDNTTISTGDEKEYVIPVKHVKPRTHIHKFGATGTLGWFTNRAA